jgi:hypothetical protein
MRTTFAVLSVLLLSVAVAHAQPDEPASPVFKVVASADKAEGAILFRERVFRIIDGRTVAEERISVFIIADCRVITPNGKQVPNDALWKRFRPSPLAQDRVLRPLRSVKTQ